MSVEEKNAANPISQILQPIRGRLIVAAILAAIGTMLAMVPLAGIAHIAQLAIGQAETVSSWSQLQEPIWRVVGVSLACLFLGMGLISVGEVVAHLADHRITGHLRLAITRRLAKVPMGWFTGRSSGEVKQAMQDDIGTLHSLTAHFFTTVGRTVGAVLIGIIYLFAMDWRMAIVSLLPFPLFFLFFSRATKASGANMQSFGAGMTRINNAVVEFVNGIPVVKAFGVEGKAHSSYRGAVDAFAEAFTDFTRPLVSAMANAHAMITPVAVLGVVLAFGTLGVSLGWITPVDILPFALVAPGICAPLLLLSYITHDLNSATAAAQRVQELLETPVLETPGGASSSLPDNDEICVEQLGYSYDGESPVLEGLNFTLKPGTVTAIVGASGSGKSTLARLLLRFFDPSDGRITLGGVDLRLIESAQLYRRIGFVLQEVRLIHASLRDNIALGRPSASQQEIEAAARIANIHERILALPRGYDSVIGENVQLSGGELQRVSIARAVLVDPPILVLDEATAAADAENEVKLQQALSRFAQGRTLMVIAHRLDTVMHADQIILIDKGAISEQGTHQQLLARKGRYARLWALGGYEQANDQAVSSC
ncbi:ATP-binding cassette subfamily B protein [Pseudomonas sp. BIGb0408]|uniref:ATP-binding cassette subfamily B protein n=1 Tax=Phytopseudomonas flavescens TaxID=29435 RepID=A0A7Y9XLB5_9GAMM|nr:MULTISPECIES: ABC transporter ATP-binding protein [Pseudomonas]MCW2293054.1 ATP-binding cassette subfamily B protein [Pseudomonas sp. BIGb0408]NYH72376.1 ATP-binding cassette subfamily B protein [Pseudomonas flavescens]